MSKRKASRFQPFSPANREKNLKLLSPAKINLFLHVVGKRADGYHDLITLICCIGLYDAIFMEFGLQKTSVHCSHPDVPDNDGNLAHRAATVFYEAMAKKPVTTHHWSGSEGVAIIIEKNIPVAAGLGGGSSNAATVLAGLNRYYGQPLSTGEMRKMAKTLGADVPFFLFKKPAVATGIGDKLKKYNGLNSFPILLVCPNFHVSTSHVYKNLNLRLTKCEKKLKNFPFEMPGFDAEAHLCNDLETVTISTFPEIAEIKERLLELDAAGALMSGSGPAVFGLFVDQKSRRRAFDELSKNTNWRVFVTEILT